MVLGMTERISVSLGDLQRVVLEGRVLCSQHMTGSYRMLRISPLLVYEEIFRYVGCCYHFSMNRSYGTKVYFFQVLPMNRPDGTKNKLKCRCSMKRLLPATRSIWRFMCRKI